MQDQFTLVGRRSNADAWERIGECTRIQRLKGLYDDSRQPAHSEKEQLIVLESSPFLHRCVAFRNTAQLQVMWALAQRGAYVYRARFQDPGYSGVALATPLLFLEMDREYSQSDNLSIFVPHRKDHSTNLRMYVCDSKDELERFVAEQREVLKPMLGSHIRQLVFQMDLVPELQRLSWVHPGLQEMINAYHRRNGATAGAPLKVAVASVAEDLPIPAPKSLHVLEAADKAVAGAHYQGFIDDMQWIDAISKMPQYRDPAVFIPAVILLGRKYLDRLGRKDTDYQEILKGVWYLRYIAAYIKNGHKPILGADVDKILAS